MFRINTVQFSMIRARGRRLTLGRLSDSSSLSINTYPSGDEVQCSLDVARVQFPTHRSTRSEWSGLMI